MFYSSSLRRTVAHTKFCLGFSGFQSRQITGWTQCWVCWVFQQTLRGKTTVESCVFMLWQQGKWATFSCSIWFSHKHTLILKALTAACMSVMMRPRPWSCTFRASRLLVMSHRKASSHRNHANHARHVMLWHVCVSSRKVEVIQT